MEYEIFNIFTNYTLEVVLIAAAAFLLTFLIKWPIKKATSKLDEDKRKMVNITIMFVPLLICTIISILYYGFKENEWCTYMVFDSSFSSFLISLSLYAIFSRIYIVIKGIFSGNAKINPELTSEVIAYIKSNIKEISSKIKVDEKTLESIVKKLEELNSLKNLLVNDTVDQDTAKIEEVDAQILELESQEASLKLAIQDGQVKIEKYKSELYKSDSSNA